MLRVASWGEPSPEAQRGQPQTNTKYDNINVYVHIHVDVYLDVNNHVDVYFGGPPCWRELSERTAPCFGVQDPAAISYFM